MFYFVFIVVLARWANPLNKIDEVNVTIEVESDDDVQSESSENVTKVARKHDKFFRHNHYVFYF